MGQICVWWCKLYNMESRGKTMVLFKLLTLYSVDGRCVLQAERKRAKINRDSFLTLDESSVPLSISVGLHPNIVMDFKDFACFQVCFDPSPGEELSAFRLISFFVLFLKCKRCIWMYESFIYACFIGMIGTFWIA